MDKIDKQGACKQADNSSDLFLRWGNKKRLRCVKVGDADDTAGPSSPVSGRRRARRNINSNFVTFSSDNDSGEPSLHLPSTRLTRTSEAATNLRSESNRKSSSEKEHKLYTAAGVVEKTKISSGGGGGGVVDESGGKSNHVWPKLYIALTSKEKEEDFMAMKGCKPSHRPKKRAKMIQRTILLVSPGAWLSDMCQERYEVREKKNTKKDLEMNESNINVLCTSTSSMSFIYSSFRHSLSCSHSQFQEETILILQHSEPKYIIDIQSHIVTPYSHIFKCTWGLVVE